MEKTREPYGSNKQLEKAYAVLHSKITPYRVQRDTGISKNTILAYRDADEIKTVKNMQKLGYYYDALAGAGYAVPEGQGAYQVQALPKRGSYFNNTFEEKARFKDFGF